MNDIAIIFNDSVVYQHSIIMVLAVAAAVLCAAGLRTIQRPDNMRSFLIMTVITIPVALLMSRFIYGFFVLESFGRIPSIMFSENGGNSLLGAALGVLAVILASKPLGLTDSIPESLDCVSPAAALALCVGRLAAVFGTDDRGFDIPESEAENYLTTANELGEQTALAVYAYESIFAGLLFVVVLLIFLSTYASKKTAPRTRPGDTALIFLLGFGGFQGVLESMRTDSMTIIGLGFVRVLQITALLCLVIPMIVFSVRAVRNNGFRKVFLCYWGAAAASLALAIYMEFTLSANFEVQKHNYSVMASCLVLVQLAAACFLLSASRRQLAPASTHFHVWPEEAHSDKDVVASSHDALRSAVNAARPKKSNKKNVSSFWDD